MNQTLRISTCVIVGVFALRPALAEEAPQPGPEDGGLRLRLIVAPRTDIAAEGYSVRLELLNVSDQPVTVRADWPGDDPGGVDAWLEAAASIECVPPVAPWIGGVQQPHRSLPQPEMALPPGALISREWQTEGRRLKNRVTNPNEVQNPDFPFPGLYSVHATVNVITTDGTVRLRSNEQLVSIGGSNSMPRYTLGPLFSVDGPQKTAVLGLGSLHRIETGDQFEIGSPKGMHWRLTITHPKPHYSLGTLELLTRSTYPPFSEPPHPCMNAALVRPR